MSTHSLSTVECSFCLKPSVMKIPSWKVTPNMATAEGGGTGLIYGYGFGPLYSAIRTLE